MADDWSITGREPEQRLIQNETMLEEGTSWVLVCPKRHRIRLYTNFKGYTTQVGCMECGRPYPLTLPSN